MRLPKQQTGAESLKWIMAVLRGGFPNIKVLRGRCKCDLALRGTAFVPHCAVVEHETSSRFQAAIMLNR
jgi:hypothetical protein